MKFLLIEDDLGVSNFIEKGLAQNGHVVETSHTGTKGLARAKAGGYDAIILDVMLPEMNGFDVASELRAAGDETPVLMLTALHTQEDIINGLELGADDYLTKPFELGELNARLGALVRGHRMRARAGNVLRFGDVEMQLVARAVHRSGRRLKLTNIEFRILETMLRSDGEVVSREHLLERVWGLTFDPGTGLVHTHIANLRAKLEAGGAPRIISPVRGMGYRLDPAEPT